jgi:acyl carrier protein
MIQPALNRLKASRGITSEWRSREGKPVRSIVSTRRFLYNAIRMASAHSSSTINDRLAEILRRDLKLGNSAAIRPDTRLLGGDHDLDSLDVLMLITSVEKSFGIKIPNEEIRKDAFTSVATLAAYIEERLAAREES